MEKLYEAELRLMEIIWNYEPIAAKKISIFSAEQLGWNKNTTYTVLKRLIEKGVLMREEPGFICSSLIKRNEMQKTETNSLIEKMFDGSKKAFFASFSDETLSKDEIKTLRELIEKKD